MSTSARYLSRVAVLVVGVGLTQTGPAKAQTFTTLHSFTAVGPLTSTNNDGAAPLAGLLSLDNKLYGTASYGGGSGKGTLFQVNANGAEFKTLYSFTATSDAKPWTNSDGANPNAGLVSSAGVLYGTGYFGGESGSGTVFAINTNGTGFRTLHSFSALSASSLRTNVDGAFPAGLIVSGNTLYGTTLRGGSSGDGTIFKINADGLGFTNLHRFAGSNGAAPLGGLILSDGRLYGTTSDGGVSGEGTVFAINVDGSGFAILHSFTALESDALTNIDGALPIAGLVLSGTKLYGTASYGGSSGYGTVFEIDTNGSGFRTLHHFTAFNPSTGANSDGAYPATGLILSGKLLYGTAKYGGVRGNGTVFALNTNGTGFATLYSFAATDPNTGTNSTGAFLFGGLTLLNDTLFGTAEYGGSSGAGTVFGLSLRPRVSITPSAAGLVLAWTTNSSGFILQSTSDLVPPVIWTTSPAGPVLVNGQNVVTNAVNGAQQFYRLSQ